MGGVTMCSELSTKVARAIRLLRTIERTTEGEIELCYSGGKDSDVILSLAKMADIKYRAIYKNTTIDPPHTIQHALDNGVEVVRPKRSMLQIIEAKGIPSRFSRFCCSELKEYKILDTAIVGIRRAESVARRDRYKEPVICRNYGKNEHVNQVLPILDWTDRDVTEFIAVESVQCHPLYYDADGKFCVNRRLGCIGCPMAADNGLAGFVKYPKMLRNWLKHQTIFLENHPYCASVKKFQSAADIAVFRLFAGSSYAKYQEITGGMFGKPNCKAFLEDYFKINLDFIK